MGSLTDSPCLFEKLSGRSGLQASKTQGCLPLVGYVTGRLPEGDPTSTTFPKMTIRWPTPRTRPYEDRLPEAGQDCTHQGCTHITVMRRGVATVQPTTPESRSRHGHRTPYGSAISRPARHCSHAGLNVIHDRRQYGPRAAGPFSQREARRRPGLPPSARGVADPQKPATPSLETCATLRRQDEVRLQ